MSIISYKEYKIENDKDYFVKNNVLLEMAQIGDIITLPVSFDDDDIEFLSNFPTSYWSMALHQRYDTFLREALFERCKQRINVEQAIFYEYVRIIKSFVGKIYSTYSKNKEYSKTTKKEIEINFESIKNLEETKNLNISDEEINKIDKKLILDWFDNKVLVKKHNEENDLEPKDTENNKQFFELGKTHYIASSIKGSVKIPKTNPIEFKWDGEKFYFQQSNIIKNIYLNERIIEIIYDENYKNSNPIEGTTITITYDYNSFNEEAIENFAQLETYNIIKKHMPFPVKSERFDPNKEDDYDFGSHGKIRSNSFIVRLIAKLEQDKDELHFEGSGLEGSKGEYGYDLSSGFKPNKKCEKDIEGFTVPKQATFEKSIKEFLSDNYHEYYGKTHEFKNYKDCLGKATGQTWEKSPDIVVLAKYHTKHLYDDQIIFNQIIKFIKNENSENIKNMKNELKEKYGEKAYDDSIEKIKILHDLKTNPKYSEEQREEIKKNITQDESIKSKFKFAQEKEVKYLPVIGLNNKNLLDTNKLAGQKDLIKSRIYEALRRATATGKDQIVKFDYFKNGEKLIYEKNIYPMDKWIDVNMPSPTNEKNIYIQKMYEKDNPEKSWDNTTQKYVEDYLAKYRSGNYDAQRILTKAARNFFDGISGKIANTIVEDLISNRKISIPHQKNNYLDHPAKSKVTHPEIINSKQKAGNIVLPHQIRNIKFVDEKGEVSEEGHRVALVFPSKFHRPIKSKSNDDDYKDDEEFNNPSYEDEDDNDDEKEITGHYGDRVILSREEHEKKSQGLGVRSPGLKLNSNAKPQQSYPKDTPQYMQSYYSINQRTDMEIKRLGDMVIRNIGAMKDAIVDKKKLIIGDSYFNVDELNDQHARPIYVHAICEVYNKSSSLKNKIASCFFVLLDHLEEQVTNNLRNPIVAYEEKNLNADEKKDKYNKFKEWLKWKIKSETQKNELKGCEKDDEGSRRKQWYVKERTTKINTGQEGERGGDDFAKEDLAKKGDTRKNIPTKHNIEKQKQEIKEKQKEQINLIDNYVREIAQHIQSNFKNIYDEKNSDDELKDKMKSLVNNYLGSNKELFDKFPNKLKNDVMSKIEDIINDQDYLDALKNTIITTEPKTTPELMMPTTTTTPKPQGMKDFLLARKQQQQQNNPIVPQQKIN